MKAIMKTGEVVEIDTKCLFNNQYNTTDGRRIFDGQISEIVDDARDGLGKCRYCGAIVRRGEEEQHFSEREAKSCTGCFWLSTKEASRETKVSADGSTETTVRKIVPHCRFADEYPEIGCTNKECRVRGIEWFTPQNTYFLRYPGGFRSGCSASALEARGFSATGYKRLTYFKKLGSYTLEAALTDEGALELYTLSNCRKHFQFRIEDGEFYKLDRTFGWKRVKMLEKVPAAVIEKVKKLCAE